MCSPSTCGTPLQQACALTLHPLEGVGQHVEDVHAGAVHPANHQLTQLPAGSVRVALCA